MRGRALVAVLALVLAGACAPAPTSSPGQAAVQERFEGGWYWPKASCVAQRESGFNPAARNGKYLGLFQIDSTNAGYVGTMHAAADTLGEPRDFFNPRVNAYTAFLILEYRRTKKDSSGRWLALDPWAPWSTAPGC